jgi:xylulokinase
MAVHLSAASCLDWVARLTGFADVGAALAAAEAHGQGGGEVFLPYLSGERTPHNDPHVRGVFTGLDNDTTPARLVHAVLEGVAFALADGLDALRQAGTDVAALRTIGGGARSAYWGGIIAAALETPLVYLDGGEVGPALGAARLAQLAVTGAAPAEVCTAPPERCTIAPDPALVDALAPRKARFRATYPALASL